MFLLSSYVAAWDLLCVFFGLGRLLFIAAFAFLFFVLVTFPVIVLFSVFAEDPPEWSLFPTPPLLPPADRAVHTDVIVLISACPTLTFFLALPTTLISNWGRAFLRSL